jgi:hypothetical protein
MTLYTDNTHEMVKVYYLDEFLALSADEFARTMDRFRSGRYELIVIEDD